MALDQTHKQNNAAVNSDGCAFELTQSPSALGRWMDAGPELMRMTSVTEASPEEKNRPLDTSHHERNKCFQMTFGKQVK